MNIHNTDGLQNKANYSELRVNCQLTLTVLTHLVFYYWDLQFGQNVD